MTDAPLTRAAKARLATRIWADFLAVHWQLRLRPLPVAVARLGSASTKTPTVSDPVRLGHIIARVLRMGRLEARCLITSLVLFRMLRRAGVDAELVIGMPDEPVSTTTHAWVELEGREVGPPPGRGAHQELVRYR